MARLASKGLIFAALVAAVAAIALASCGEPSEEGEAGVGFAGCGPENVADHLGGFLDAVSARQDERVLHYIAPRGEFIRFRLDDRVNPGGGRDESHSPGELHDSFLAAIPKNQVSEFLAVEVGEPGPLAPAYRQRVGPRETAGVQVAARVGGDRFLSGEFGVECDAGRIYSGAVRLQPHLETRSACGQAIGAGAETTVCRREH